MTAAEIRTADEYRSRAAHLFAKADAELRVARLWKREYPAKQTTVEDAVGLARQWHKLAVYWTRRANRMEASAA